MFIKLPIFIFISTEGGAATSGHGGSLYNGENNVLYWADASSEIAFVVPTRLSGESSLAVVSSETSQTHGPGNNCLSLSKTKHISVFYLFALIQHYELSGF